MPLTYTTNEDSRPIIANLIKLFYPDLAEAKVTFEILECDGGLKLHGYGVSAVIKSNSLKDRVAGLSDVRIVLDAETWGELDKKGRQALIDHELYHLEVVRDKEGIVKKDDCGRPRIRLKLHDWQLGGFSAVVARNKEYALEAQNFAFWEQKLRQIEFDWNAAELAIANGSPDSANSEAAA